MPGNDSVSDNAFDVTGPSEYDRMVCGLDEVPFSHVTAAIRREYRRIWNEWFPCEATQALLVVTSDSGVESGYSYRRDVMILEIGDALTAADLRALP